MSNSDTSFQNHLNCLVQYSLLYLLLLLGHHLIYLRFWVCISFWTWVLVIIFVFFLRLFFFAFNIQISTSARFKYLFNSAPFRASPWIPSLTSNSQFQSQLKWLWENCFPTPSSSVHTLVSEPYYQMLYSSAPLSYLLTNPVLLDWYSLHRIKLALPKLKRY